MKSELCDIKGIKCGGEKSVEYLHVPQVKL